MMRLKSGIYLLAILLFTSLSVLASDDCGPGTPGGGGDIDDPPVSNTPCEVPLDTWVYVLVIAAVMFGAYHLYKKQKRLSA